ncbi:Bcr/CflA family efflux MFS transporter [Verminephrobacter aporrectodeae subsp. tuberculatae]|uniref:Bcr/CflA family efflux transporter n=1 Tax=Verminephrobacter aporrectodeae subsp. tuberculatae TaxID=1110392 RepID=A0ABT3KNR1_9BURK|nr:multidrug effflux MFS transporter [Verminephrobacter aporrectodeae]MCW5319944.1 Bcr/CflA family efflux MFS transporter [Verminephrobacter aporrectodeae subsp. tuberculatae]
MPAPCASVASAAAVPVPVRPGLAILVLALLLSLQPVTTDLYLPALPALTRSLGASMADAQLTLSALLLAFGCSQMFWGPLSDRFGRRPILLVGLGAYTLASLGSAFAPAMDLLILWRSAQGAAMGAVVVCARAIVRDLYDPLEGARAMSRAFTGLGIVACACAPLGGLLSAWLGWRAALLALTVYAALTLALVVLHLPETLAQRNPQALRPATLLGTWLQVLRSPTFWAFSLLTMATYGGLFTFLAASSFVYIDVLGLTRTQYGWVMASAGVAYFGGTFLCRRLLVHHGLLRTVAIAGGLSLGGGALLVLFAWLGWQRPWVLVLPYYLFMLGHGIHQPCGQSGALGPFPRAAGVASALNGCLMMLAAFAIGGWLGRRLDGTVWPLVNGIGFWSLVLALVSWTLVQRFGDPARAPA